MKDTFDALLTTVLIVVVLAFLGWHAFEADKAVDHYSQWLEQQMQPERWAG